MRIYLISKVVDNARPPYTTFTVEVLESGSAARMLLDQLRRLLPEGTCLIDTQLHGRQVVFTVVDVGQARVLLMGQLPELARLVV